MPHFEILHNLNESSRPHYKPRVEVLDLSFYRPKLNCVCFNAFYQNWVCFDFVLDSNLFLDRGISVAKLQLLDLQSRNFNRANRPGTYFKSLKFLLTTLLAPKKVRKATKKNESIDIPTQKEYYLF